MCSSASACICVPTLLESGIYGASVTHMQAVMHYGEAIKAIMNEEAGDGIESAIDCFLDVKVIEGKAGEKRLCVVINGKVSSSLLYSALPVSEHQDLPLPTSPSLHLSARVSFNTC